MAFDTSEKPVLISHGGRKPRIPANIRVLWNKISRARKAYTLACGCVVQPGTPYHSVGTIVTPSSGKPYFARSRGHLGGCLEKLH